MPATTVALLLQVPPVDELLNVADPPLHNVVEPLMAAGFTFTVSTLAASTQPFPNV